MTDNGLTYLGNRGPPWAFFYLVTGRPAKTVIQTLQVKYNLLHYTGLSLR
jgi:hypothetical protein